MLKRYTFGDMNITKEELKEERRAKKLAILFTSLFFVLVVIMLFLLGLWKPWPPPPEEGVMIAFGEIENVEVGGVPESSPTQPINPSQPEEVPQEEVITQDVEDAPVIEKTEPKEQPNKPVEQPEPITEKTKEAETEAEQEPEKPVIDPSALYKGPRGTLSKPGRGGGKPTGSKEGKGSSGNTGIGTSGIGYSLAGRTLKSVPQVRDESQETGIVVIKIWVDPQGNVKRAQYDPSKSTTTNKRLIDLALRAARQAKFNADPTAPPEQIGTMTFRFRID